MCGSVSLESSYEKASRCIYTSTVLYEYGELGLMPIDANRTGLHWRLAYTEVCEFMHSVLIVNMLYLLEINN